MHVHEQYMMMMMMMMMMMLSTRMLQDTMITIGEESVVHKNIQHKKGYETNQI